MDHLQQRRNRNLDKYRGVNWRLQSRTASWRGYRDCRNRSHWKGVSVLIAMKKLIAIVFLVTFTVFAATLYRDPSMSVAGVDYGMTPTNSPNIGDVLTATAGGAAWTSLTNFPQNWSGTSGGLLVPIGATVFLPPNNSSSNLITSELAGATRCPITRALTLQNLFVVSSPAPGSGKTTTVTIMTNGVASPIVATVSATATNANDTTHTVYVPAGTEIGVKIVTSALSTAGKCAWSFEGR